MIGITCAMLTWQYVGIISRHGSSQSMNLSVTNPAAPSKDSVETTMEILTVRTTSICRLGCGQLFPGCVIPMVHFPGSVIPRVRDSQDSIPFGSKPHSQDIPGPRTSVTLALTLTLTITSGVATMEQMEQLLPPGMPRTTYVIRADPRRFFRGKWDGKGVQGLNGLFDIAVFVNYCCHQIAYIKAIMHQIRFRLGLRSPRSPSWILGVLLLREGREGKGEGKGGEEGSEGREGKWEEGGEGRDGKGKGGGKGREDPLDLLPPEKFPSYATVTLGIADPGNGEPAPQTEPRLSF